MKKSTKADLFFLLTFFVISLVLMMNFDIQTANLHNDDGPIFYAKDFVSPQLFKGDYLHGIPVDLITPFRLWTSLQILIPGLLYKLINIDPYASTWIITFLQIFGFGCAVYYFLKAAGLSKKMAWLGVAFAYPAGMWGWSFTYAESDFRSILAPIPAILCLTPLLFSFTEFLKNNIKSGYFLLLLAGLIHPPMALYAIGTLTLWRLFQSGLSHLKEFVPHLAVLGLISVVISAPSFLIKSVLTFNTLPLEEVIKGMKLNVHIWPWGFGLHWPPLQTSLIWILIAYMGYRIAAKRNAAYSNLWIASLASGVIFGLSHIFGAAIKNTTLMDLIGLRSFTIAVFISFPFILIFFEQYYFSQSYLFRFVSLLFFFQSFVTQQYGLSWFLAVSLVLLVIAGTPRYKLASPLKILDPRLLTGFAWVLTGSFIGLFVLGDRIDQLPIPSVLGKGIEFFFGYLYLYPDLWILIPGIVFVGCIALLDKKAVMQIKDPFIQNHFADLAVAGSVVLMTLSILPQMIGDRNPEALARVEVQAWAKNNTPLGSVFWAPDFNGWRSYSERRRVDDLTRENYAYVYAIKEATEFRMRTLKIYEQADGTRDIPLDMDLNQKQWYKAREFNAKQYRQLGKEFGVNYVVLKRYEFAAPDLPVIYKNAYFDVYQVTAN